jgi:hypothetical protein
MKYTKPQSSYHERNLGILNTRAARRIHQVEYPGMNHIKGVMRGLVLGILVWGVVLAVSILVFALAVR